MNAGFISELRPGPIDIVGDVHGEFEILLALVQSLGYTEQGEHPQGRRLVFVGDLCDRGPDSPAVIRWVRERVREERAHCIMGNHELNLVRGERKEGNAWFFGEVEGGPQVLASASDRAEFLEFFQCLPVALQGPDLRVVHACWHAPSLRMLEQAASRPQMLQYSVVLPPELEEAADEVDVDLRDSSAPPPLHPALVEAELLRQNTNPIRVVTAGLEEATPEPFWAGGRWRVVRRARWWKDYDGVMTVVGHYWRSIQSALQTYKGERLFDGEHPFEPLGPAKNVMCVDYSIGRRWRERAEGQSARTALAAYRWPERNVVLGPL